MDFIVGKSGWLYERFPTTKEMTGRVFPPPEYTKSESFSATFNDFAYGSRHWADGRMYYSVGPEKSRYMAYADDARDDAGAQFIPNISERAMSSRFGIPNPNDWKRWYGKRRREPGFQFPGLPYYDPDKRPRISGGGHLPAIEAPPMAPGYGPNRKTGYTRYARRGRINYRRVGLKFKQKKRSGTWSTNSSRRSTRKSYSKKGR